MKTVARPKILSKISRTACPFSLTAPFATNLDPAKWLPAAVGLALLSAILLPLNLLSSLPFHQDEALYATWAMEIASGRNPWLVEVPIDKPPLFLYAAAGSMWLLGPTETAARLPSVLATVCTVGLTFWLGRRLYNSRVGLLAAWLALFAGETAHGLHRFYRLLKLLERLG